MLINDNFNFSGQQYLSKSHIENTQNGIKLNLVKYHLYCFHKSIIVNYLVINVNWNCLMSQNKITLLIELN